MAQNKFSEIITATRKRRGISQKQAALELGISSALLSHYENGIRECSLDFLIKLADYYGVTCDYLLGHSPARAIRSAAARTQRSLVRSLETLFVLTERADDEKLAENLALFYKDQIYRGLKLFDGICDGLYFQSDDDSVSFAAADAEISFTKAYKRAQNLKDSEIPLHEKGLEYPERIINEVEIALQEKGLL